MILITDDLMYDWCDFISKKYHKDFLVTMANQESYVPNLEIHDLYKYKHTEIVKQIGNFGEKIILCMDATKEGLPDRISTASKYLSNFEIILYTDKETLYSKIKKYKIESIMGYNFSFLLDIMFNCNLKDLLLVHYSNSLYDVNEEHTEEKLFNYSRENRIRYSFQSRVITNEEAKQFKII